MSADANMLTNQIQTIRLTYLSYRRNTRCSCWTRVQASEHSHSETGLKQVLPKVWPASLLGMITLSQVIYQREINRQDPQEGTDQGKATIMSTSAFVGHSIFQHILTIHPTAPLSHPCRALP